MPTAITPERLFACGLGPARIGSEMTASPRSMTCASRADHRMLDSHAGPARLS
jgi:hypothetical protein